MHKVSDKIITFLPPETIDPNAMEQIKNISEMPFVYRHVAVMPDCHLGKGATVGTVLATQGAIIPAAVGVDIGCGMIAVKTNLRYIQHRDDFIFYRKEGLYKMSAVGGPDIGDLESVTVAGGPDILEKIKTGIERRIPMSAGKFRSKISDTAQVRIEKLEEFAGGNIFNIDSYASNWRQQLGTLGGGNHFIELCVAEDDTIWATLHSGSRGIGNKIGVHHIKVAQKVCDDMFVQLKDRDLAYLPLGTVEASNYLRELHWAQAFALANREEMMDQFLMELADVIFGDYSKFKDLEVERINCHHNFTQQEEHMGHNVWITRKGAIQVKRGMKGMIPGSMGTASYIVRGLENPMAYHSAPHGAGRKFSRGEARKQFNMEDFDKAMVGIVHRRNDVLLDEIPGAYKQIETVMENAKELVEVETVLHQILNCKGD